jgi:hypothetical protein
MVETTAPIFGWGRSTAASRAIAELANAKAEYDRRCTGWADYDEPAARERYRAAQANRAQYAEYGD